jgi:hypothetical protein
MTENKKPEYVIDWGLLDWTPDERRQARLITRRGLTLPQNILAVARTIELRDKLEQINKKVGK